ncbi:hypothetical protein CsatB_018651 [Cannabis sativa]
MIRKTKSLQIQMDCQLQTKERVCELCGGNDGNFKHLLVTCSVCNTTCEHIYCMRGEVKDEIPEYWVCESCQSVSYSTLIETEKNDEAVTRALRNGKFSVSQLHSNKQKTVETGGKTKDVQEGELPKFPPSFSSYITFFPAPNATWKGDFSILNWTPCELLGRFQAQLPCKVHQKVYEISRKMPAVLQLKMLPRCHVFTDLFQDVCPDLLDVGMYFFPADDNSTSSRQEYVKLFEYLEFHKSVMTSCVNGVELLIFSSTQLNDDSQNILSSESKQFFWGIFRSSTNNNTPLPSNAHEKLPTSVSSMTDDEDMEIEVPLIRKRRRSVESRKD